MKISGKTSIFSCRFRVFSLVLYGLLTFALLSGCTTAEVKPQPVQELSISPHQAFADLRAGNRCYRVASRLFP